MTNIIEQFTNYEFKWNKFTESVIVMQDKIRALDGIKIITRMIQRCQIKQKYRIVLCVEILNKFMCTYI